MDEPGCFDCLFLCERKTGKKKVLENVVELATYTYLSLIDGER